MKRTFISLVVLMFLLSGTVSQAHNSPYNYNHHHSGCSSSCVYLIKSEISQENNKFIDCNQHSLSTQITTNYYSNGTKRKFYNHTVLNSDGSILLSDCTDIEHFICDNKHFFYYKKGKYYTIVDDKLNVLNSRNYTKMTKISPNKLLVVYNKNYGIIDLFENDIVPIKYKSFEKVGLNLYLTKLNGYYGLLDDSNNILIRNECEKIKQVHDTFVFKKYKKYGLANKNGQIILEAKYDKIKTIGEYILVKKDSQYNIFDFSGKKITEKKYEKVKLERNVLKGKTNNGWEKIK